MKPSPPLPLHEKRRKLLKKFHRRSDTQAGTLRHSQREMLCIMAQNPVWPCHNSGKQYRHIGLVANQMPIGLHDIRARIRNRLRPGKFNQAPIILDQLLRFLRAKPPGREEQVLLHLVAHKESTALSSPHGETIPPVITFESRNSRSLRAPVTCYDSCESGHAAPLPPEHSRHSGAQRLSAASWGVWAAERKS